MNILYNVCHKHILNFFLSAATASPIPFYCIHCITIIKQAYYIILNYNFDLSSNSFNLYTTDNNDNFEIKYINGKEINDEYINDAEVKDNKILFSLGAYKIATFKIFL